MDDKPGTTAKSSPIAILLWVVARTKTSIMSLAKPVMRGMLTAQIKKNLIVATGLSIVTVAAWKYFIQYPRMQKYADFYKDYDAQKEFDRIRNLGLFQSCRPDGEE
ncbi:hypothetical protein Pcinc_021031 [Petrolisthes cinctipes]|uniref:Mitochondrial cytochrome c oxidase subunit VIc/VIIs domain-containing protein n=1 Tax=Petrolisthes cinctipes TaxID=88211 RepID=A0AAE1KIZ8_PETCI|nr:hypothetical protein Pcinc_021031 [Petrolisthes cinctipes]